MTTPDPTTRGLGPAAPEDATSPYDVAPAGAGSQAVGAPPPPPPADTSPSPGPPGPVPSPAPAQHAPAQTVNRVPPPVPASRPANPGLVAGIILVAVGCAFLLVRVVDIAYTGATWPLWIVVPGLAMLVGSFFIPPRGGLGLAIPGAIVTMVGLVLWVQAYYGLYATWVYAWALVAPTGPGLGMLLYGLVHRDADLVHDGLRTTLIGLGLFAGFALFFEGVVGLSGNRIANLDEVLPYALVGLGALLVVLSFLGGGRRRDRRGTAT